MNFSHTSAQLGRSWISLHAIHSCEICEWHSYCLIREKTPREEMFMNKQLVAELTKELKRKKLSLMFDGGPTEILPEQTDKESEIEEHVQTDRATKVTLHLKERDHENLRAIDAALDHVAIGTYGICQSCGEEIKAERLKALPTARLCIDCAKDREMKTRTPAGSGPVLYSRIDFDPLEGD
jgi:DnaK suppressor protein